MIKILQHLSNNLFYSLTVAALIGLSACTSPSASAPPVTTPASATTPAPGPGVTIDLTAQSLSFNMSTITVPAGSGVTVNFNNKDNVPHNFAVYQNLAGGQTKKIFAGNIVSGPGSTVYQFTAPTSAGSYFFECDVHPQNMNGTFVVTVP